MLEKTPTTPADQSTGVLAGLERLAEAEGLARTSSRFWTDRSIVHGTTTADNTMIQMTGATTGLLVTEGFRDEIEMRRCFKEDIWDPALERRRPSPAGGCGWRSPSGSPPRGGRRPLDEEGVRKAARPPARLRRDLDRRVVPALLPEPGARARAREIILDEYPDVELISLSHEVFPKPPEFERTSTTLVNAYVGPPIVRYLGRLEAALADAGFSRELLLATCSGGVATPDASGAVRSPPSAPARPAAWWPPLDAAARAGLGRRGQRRHGRHQL